MKTLTIILCLFWGAFTFAQKSFFDFEYDENNLSNIDTIPDFQTQDYKLKITGTVYENDGITPAKDVVFYIEQANAYGDFDLRGKKDKRYVYHRAWVKTANDGRYTFYAFEPGNDKRFNLLKQIFPIIKTPNGKVYVLDSFLFDNDPLLSKRCRKKINKIGDSSRILKPHKIKELFVVEKDIVLHDHKVSIK